MRITNSGGAAHLSVIGEIEPPRPAALLPEDVTLALARGLYAERRRRDRFFPPDLFGEPCWDILLDLYIACREGRQVPTTSACIGAHVPPTTALRWLRILEARGLVEREHDRRDGRRTFVQLSRRGDALVSDFFASSSAAKMLMGQKCAQARGENG